MLCVALYSRPYVVYHLSRLRQGLSASRLVQLLRPVWVVTIHCESHLLQVRLLGKETLGQLESNNNAAALEVRQVADVVYIVVITLFVGDVHC